MKPGDTTRLAFVDTETLALRHGPQMVWEAALILGDLHYPADPGEGPQQDSYDRHPTLTVTDTWVGFIDVDLADADPMSLRLNRLYERHPQFNAPYGEMGGRAVSAGEVHYGWRFPGGLVWTRKAAAHEVARLLFDRTVLGAIPWFDEGQLAAMCRAEGQCLAVHYHLVDVEALLAGAVAGSHRLIHGAKYLSDPVPAGCLPPYSTRELAKLAGAPALDEPAHEALPDARWVLDVYTAVNGIEVAWPASSGQVHLPPDRPNPPMSARRKGSLRVGDAAGKPLTPLGETPDLNVTGPVVPDPEAGVWRPWSKDDPTALAVWPGRVDLDRETDDGFTNGAAEPAQASQEDIRAARSAGGADDTGPAVFEEVVYGDGADVSPPGDPSRNVVATVEGRLRDVLEEACTRAGIEFDNPLDLRRTLDIFAGVVTAETAAANRRVEKLTADLAMERDDKAAIVAALFPGRPAPRITWEADARNLRDAYIQLRTADDLRRTPIPPEAAE